MSPNLSQNDDSPHSALDSSNQNTVKSGSSKNKSSQAN